MFLRLICILFVVFLASCASQKTAKNIQTNSNTQADTSRIIFVVLQIKTDSVTGKNTVSLVSKKPVAGSTKKQQQNPGTNTIIIHHYIADKLVDSILLPHPLFAEYEYLNDDKSFGNKQIQKTEAEFFFRLQSNSKYNKIIISEQLKDKPRTILNTIHI